MQLTCAYPQVASSAKSINKYAAAAAVANSRNISATEPMRRNPSQSQRRSTWRYLQLVRDRAAISMVPTLDQWHTRLIDKCLNRSKETFFWASRSQKPWRQQQQQHQHRRWQRPGKGERKSSTRHRERVSAFYPAVQISLAAII